MTLRATRSSGSRSMRSSPWSACSSRFAGERSAQRVHSAGALTKGKGNVFQGLEDAAELVAEYAGFDLSALAGAKRWRRLH